MPNPISRDIFVVEPNHEGCDYVIGSVMGFSDLFMGAYNDLKPQDRLFVSGNLVGSGPDSFGLLQRVWEINQERQRQNLPPQIYLVRGCNEDNIPHLYQQESNPRKFESSTEPVILEKGAYSLASKLRAYSASWVTKLRAQEVEEVLSYLQDLPFLIHCIGLKGFTVVAAENPFQDSVLRRRITASKTELSPKEELGAISVDHPIERPYTRTQRLTFTGNYNTGASLTRARVSTNAYTLNSQCLLRINISQLTCQIIGNSSNFNQKIDSDPPTTPQCLKQELNQYFTYYQILVAASDFKFNAIDIIVDQVKDGLSSDEKTLIRTNRLGYALEFAKNLQPQPHHSPLLVRACRHLLMAQEWIDLAYSQDNPSSALTLLSETFKQQGELLYKYWDRALFYFFKGLGPRGQAVIDKISIQSRGMAALLSPQANLGAETSPSTSASSPQLS